MPEEVRVSIRYKAKGLIHVIHESRVVLDHPGQEKAVVSFMMKNGRLVKDSLDFAPFQIFYPLLKERGIVGPSGK